MIIIPQTLFMQLIISAVNLLRKIEIKVVNDINHVNDAIHTPKIK